MGTVEKNPLYLLHHIFQVKSVIAVEPNHFNIVLETDAIAAWVWLEATGIQGHFTDNGFMMVTHRQLIAFYSWHDHVTDKDLMKALTVSSYIDWYR